MADNIIRVAAPVQKHVEQWVASSPLYGEWTSLSRTCGAWAPDAATIPSGQSFSQSRSCNQQESRTIQQREYNSQQNLYRNVGEPATENRSVTEEESQNAVGTKAVVSTLKINNPVAGVNGIYSVTDTASNTNFNAYVNMTYDGGYWVLALYWTSPAQITRTNRQLVYKDNPISTFSSNESIYPVMPSGIINGATRGMLVSLNSGWTNLFGAWQSFELLNPGELKAGYLAKTPLGNKTIYPMAAGWGGRVTEAGTFGFWSVYGKNGGCGGDGVIGSGKYCPSTNFGNWSLHADGSSGKFYYLKAE